MNNYAVFTDVSLNPQLKIGIGAILILPQSILVADTNEINNQDLYDKISVKVFKDTSSTKLELQTFFWAFEVLTEEMKNPNLCKLSFYTDSQCIANLTDRRHRLESSGFSSKRTGRELNNSEYYQKLFYLKDTIAFDIIKVKGHSVSKNLDTIHTIFSIVDRKARQELKLWIKEHPKIIHTGTGG
jgi:ribonuclease HI